MTHMTGGFKGKGWRLIAAFGPGPGDDQLGEKLHGFPRAAARDCATPRGVKAGAAGAGGDTGIFGMDLASRLTIAAATGVTGVVVMAAMVHTPASLVHGPSGPTLAVWASVLLGAMLAGGLLARFFGAPGQAGLWQAALGAVLATALGAALCGLVIVLALPGAVEAMLAQKPVWGLVTCLIWAPLLVLDSMLRSSAIAALWLAGMGTVQVLALHRSRPARHQQPRTAKIA